GRPRSRGLPALAATRAAAPDRAMMVFPALAATRAAAPDRAMVASASRIAPVRGGRGARMGALLAMLAGCAPPTFRAPPPHLESMDEAAIRLVARAGRDRELRALEALH